MREAPSQKVSAWTSFTARYCPCPTCLFSALTIHFDWTRYKWDTTNPETCKQFYLQLVSDYLSLENFLLTAQRQVQESFEHEGKHFQKLYTGSLPDNSSVNFPKLRAILLAQACLSFSLLILLLFRCAFYCVISKSIFLGISLCVISMGIYYFTPVWFHCVFGGVISAHISLCVISMGISVRVISLCISLCVISWSISLCISLYVLSLCVISSVYSTVPGSASRCAEPVVATNAYCWRGNLSSSSESEWCTLPSGVALSWQWRVELCGWGREACAQWHCRRVR